MALVYRALNEKELVRLIEDGNEDALEEFIRRWTGSSYAYSNIRKKHKQELLNSYAIGYAEGTGYP